jgi:hypothetical protein
MAPDLLFGSRSKTAGWSPAPSDVVELARWEKARRSSGWRRSVLIGAGDGRACSPSRWRCAGRRGGGAPAVDVEGGIWRLAAGSGGAGREVAGIWQC